MDSSSILVYLLEAVTCSFSLLYGIPWYGYFMLCLSIFLKTLGMLPIFWLLWIELLWMFFIYDSLGTCVSFLLVMYSWVELALVNSAQQFSKVGSY